MTRQARWAIWLAALLLQGGVASPLCRATESTEEFLHVVAGVHFDSRISGGRYAIDELAGIAFQKRLHAAVITDRDNATVEYGLWPLRKLLRLRFSAGSIRDLGGQKYLAAFRAAHARHPRVLLIPGAEAMPYYYWEVNLAQALRGRGREAFKVHNLHEHLLVIGLPRGEDYDGLPSLARGYPLTFTPACLLNLLWLGIIIVALRLGLRYRRRWQPLNIFLFLAGLALLLNGLLDWPRQVDPYHGDQGVKPYQALIDYVNKRGGMTFWAHPEVEANVPIKGIATHTPAYYRHLLLTRDYTGFAIFWEGIRYVGCVGGVWDQVLADYCAGRRKSPVWALGELDFEGEGRTDTIRECLTVFLVKQNTEKEMLTALRTGRMYAARNHALDSLRLDEWSVRSSDGQSVALSGDTLRAPGPVDLRLKLTILEQTHPDLTLQIIRDGKQIASLPLSQQQDWTFRDPDTPKRRMSFYRVLLLSRGHPILATNPIFVR